MKFEQLIVALAIVTSPALGQRIGQSHKKTLVSFRFKFVEMASKTIDKSSSSKTHRHFHSILLVLTASSTAQDPSPSPNERRDHYTDVLYSFAGRCPV